VKPRAPRSQVADGSGQTGTGASGLDPRKGVIGTSFRTEGQALNFVRSRIASGTVVNADESASSDGRDLGNEPQNICRFLRLLAETPQP
jgi:hypothetical protein